MVFIYSLMPPRNIISTVTIPKIAPSYISTILIKLSVSRSYHRIPSTIHFHLNKFPCADNSILVFIILIIGTTTQPQ